MYVRKKIGIIHFRLWNADDPKLWEQHGWAPYDAIRQASAMYDKKSGFDPDQVYSLDIAKALITENR